MNLRRADIQALRTVAVLSVVIYHLWPERLTGGYVGVDIFFVLSGFLITAHMLREVARTGTVALTAFWARRARRLLPAAFLVLVVSLALTALVLPKVFWAQNFEEIGAAALYFLNWNLASDEVNYLAAGNTASLVQHYWSLSVEEQFYIFWPLVIVGAVWIATRLRSSNKTKIIGLSIAAVVAASFVYSVFLTATSPSAAYFVTPTRAWEFGAGALFAIAVATPRTDWVVIRSWVSWIGFGAIAIAVLTYDSSTPFPGYAALLPVAGTLAVLWAGTPDHAWSPNALVRFGPVQWVGDISYSLYLWHWPLIIAAPFVITGDLGTKWKIVILATSVLLAWGTKVVVEDPARQARVFTSRLPRWTFVATAVAMSVMVGGVAIGLQTVSVDKTESQTLSQELLNDPSLDCLGASAYAASDAPCSDERLSEILVPSLVALRADTGGAYRCFAEKGLAIEVCKYGSTRPDAKRVALVGDSHAAMLLPGVVEHLEAQNWALDTYLGATCVWGNFGDSADCDYRRTLQHDIETAGPYDLILTTASRIANGERSAYARTGDKDDRVAGYQAAWRPVVANGTRIVVVSDNPFLGKEIQDCWIKAEDKTATQKCGLTTGGAYWGNDALKEAAQTTEGVGLVDTQDLFCRKGWCPVEMGGVRVYWDQQHITATFSRTLAPHLVERINSAMSWAG
ncbi:hypothetical protein ASC66_09485 [Leifsonia sp. Root4]|uniref:acyltransferase family protein n=1 Tax=Leifsonia sp. Root4 TaxID=1736525 RepID=UPI0006FE0BC2|nr:acyltransferase family protein [Leifsonia sp. Root4]KQW06676.1 hypothetical protein ASC66_09485 [Leifsonia sp. Root4]